MKYSSIVEAAAGPTMTVPEGWGQGRATFGGLLRNKGFSLGGGGVDR